jgi:hypothetical protein
MLSLVITTINYLPLTVPLARSYRLPIVQLKWTIQSLQSVLEWGSIWFTIVVEGSYCRCMRTLKKEIMKEMGIKRQEFDTEICNKPGTRKHRVPVT